MQKITARPVKSTQKRKTEKYPVYEIITMVLCFLISRAGMFGLTIPLGISYLAVTQKKDWWSRGRFFSCVCGYLSVGGYLNTLSAIVFCLISFFENKNVRRSKFASALYAGGSVVICGLPVTLWMGGYMTDILKMILSAASAFFGVYIFAIASDVLKSAGKRNFLKQEEAVSLAVLLSLAALGFPAGRIGYVTPMSVVCVFLVMFFSLSGKLGISSAAGLVCGFLLGNGSDGLFAYIGTLGLCGLLGGLFGGLGKAGVITAFLLGDFVNACFAETPEKIAINIIDIAIAVLIFAIVPKSAAGFLGIMRKDNQDYDDGTRVKDAFREKLGHISDAFSQLSASMSFFNKTYTRQKLDRFSIYDKASDEICRDCGMSSLCWQKYYGDTYETMMRCFREIEKSGKVTVDFLPDFFRDRCEDCEGFIKAINHSYEEVKNELVWQDRLLKTNKLSAGRFGEAARIVGELCENIDQNISFNDELAHAAACALDKQGMDVKRVSVFKNPYGRYEVKILCKSCGGGGKCSDMAKVLSEILECGMEKGAGDCMLNDCTVTFTQVGLYSIEHSVRGIPKKGEVVSGDNATSYTMPDGNCLLAISDGRGFGGEANLQSSETLRLLCKLLNAGFAADVALRLSNTAMAVQADQEQFATVDAAVIDTVTASGVFIKNGACSTYVKRGLKLIEIPCDSLPLGIGTDFEATEKYLQLAAGDIVIMISDGVSDAFSSPDDLKTEILMIKDNASVDEITSSILNAAVSNNIREDDDMTVIAARIKDRH